MLVTFTVHTLVDRAVLPRLLALAILEIVDPIALVLRSIYIEIGAEAMSLVIAPLTVKDITVNMVEDASTVRLVVLPLSLVARTIRPSLLSKAVSEPSKP